MEIWQEAARQAVLNVYLYLLDERTPIAGQRFEDAVAKLRANGERERYRISLLQNAVGKDPILAGTKLIDSISVPGGLRAAVFEDVRGHISVVFRGTGRNEWRDNGEALSGERRHNLYFGFRPRCDYASAAQAEALNWFYSLALEQGWDENDHIMLSGHSKGGNKAQFVTVHTDLVDKCFSFDGQGFSPEALDCFAREQGGDFELRRRRIYSLSADNDYVNVLGERLMPEEHIYFFEAPMGQDNAVLYHLPEAILTEQGKLNPRSTQGGISQTVEHLSEEVMDLPPRRRKYVTEGLMSLVQSYVDGKATDILDGIRKLIKA